ncbi:hypothetical protein APSETT444_002656 [Aspergillus pseudonomiae]
MAPGEGKTGDGEDGNSGLKHQLDPELFKAKGEEIGKQLHIYKNAAKSIVWLHPTSWDEDSAMKDLLLEMSRPGYQEPKLVQEYTEKVENWLRTAQMDEHWLKSGWTLEEGVLLGSTLLIDGHGNTFSDSRFYNGSQATVRDLSIPDSCWALIGALELEDIEVSYDFPMPEIKRRFLSALVDKYQWMMLFLPFWECQVEEEGATGTVKRPFQWTDIVDDALLPASLFLVESHTDPELPLEKEPTLHFSDEDFISEDLRVKARDGQRMSLFRVSEDYITYFRHYRQDSNGLRIVSSQTVTVAEDPLLANAWLLPLWNVNMKGDVRGKRCLLVLRLEGPTATDQPVHAAFGGMLDVWGMGSKKVDIREMSLASCRKHS